MVWPISVWVRGIHQLDVKEKKRKENRLGGSGLLRKGPQTLKKPELVGGFTKGKTSIERLVKIGGV